MPEDLCQGVRPPARARAYLPVAPEPAGVAPTVPPLEQDEPPARQTTRVLPTLAGQGLVEAYEGL
ncbi:hypothetical protein PSP20601_04947 [Pandoraea sputorum]|nr:hypothetical protein PSP20601_04947 [Pandoraea sputorum]